jgi:hypothetical protein
MPQEHINVILSGLEGLAQTEDREIASLFMSALSSVKASASRATIARARVGYLARYSVAASASATLRSYLASPSRSAERDGAMHNVMKAALSLAEGAESKRFEDHNVEATPPEGWTQEEPGVFTRATTAGNAEIFYSPHMPGGDWSLRLSGLPVGFGTSPDETAASLEDYVSFMAAQSGRPPRASAFNSLRRSVR